MRVLFKPLVGPVFFKDVPEEEIHQTTFDVRIRIPVSAPVTQEPLLGASMKYAFREYKYTGRGHDEDGSYIVVKETL